MAVEIDWSQLSPQEFRRINKEIRIQAKKELKKDHNFASVHKHITETAAKLKQWKIDHPERVKQYRQKRRKKNQEEQRASIRYLRAKRKNKLEEELKTSLMVVKKIRRHLVYHGGNNEINGINTMAENDLVHRSE